MTGMHHPPDDSYEPTPEELERVQGLLAALGEERAPAAVVTRLDAALERELPPRELESARRRRRWRPALWAGFAVPAAAALVLVAVVVGTNGGDDEGSDSRDAAAVTAAAPATSAAAEEQAPEAAQDAASAAAAASEPEQSFKANEQADEAAPAEEMQAGSTEAATQHAGAPGDARGRRRRQGEGGSGADANEPARGVQRGRERGSRVERRRPRELGGRRVEHPRVDRRRGDDRRRRLRAHGRRRHPRGRPAARGGRTAGLRARARGGLPAAEPVTSASVYATCPVCGGSTSLEWDRCGWCGAQRLLRARRHVRRAPPRRGHRAAPARDGHRRAALRGADRRDPGRPRPRGHRRRAGRGRRRTGRGDPLDPARRVLHLPRRRDRCPRRGRSASNCSNVHVVTRDGAPVSYQRAAVREGVGQARWS